MQQNMVSVHQNVVSLSILLSAKSEFENCSGSLKFVRRRLRVSDGRG